MISSLRLLKRSALRAIERPLDLAWSHLGPVEYWRKRYAHRWRLQDSLDIVAAEGALTGPDSLFLRHPLLVEEYSILDALIRRALERRDRVQIADVACGGGLACFFIAANRERYGDRVTYVGVDASPWQLMVARIRNPWSFASFHEGNVYATGLPSSRFDIVINWQVLNHVGKFPAALIELSRVSRGVIHLINLIYYPHEEFVRRFKTRTTEAIWGDLAVAFDREAAEHVIAEIGDAQLWKRIGEDRFPPGSVPDGATAEHTLVVKPTFGLQDWTDLDLRQDWQDALRHL